MLPLLKEYNVAHHRFGEHLRVAITMAMVAPGCAVMFLNLLGWFNPWLWGCCGVGLSLALGLYSVVKLHHQPPGITAMGRRLVATSPDWFPYFFVVIQSCIASLILLFLWFSISSMILDLPLYVHAILLTLAFLVPVRRYVWARVQRSDPGPYFVLSETFRAVWHMLITIFLARVVIGVTISDLNDTSPENLAWYTIVWVPALLYIVFILAVTLEHLFHRKKAGTPLPDVNKAEEPMDRF